jgi:hypothetical protein
MQRLFHESVAPALQIAAVQEGPTLIMEVKKMRFFAFAGVALSLFAPSAFAEPDSLPDCPPGRACRVPSKEVSFNLVCYYNDRHNPEGYENCKAAAKFQKDVTTDGGEVADDSTFKDNPQLEVSCGHSTLFNNSARRFTDLLGSRIQGETGPHPAITLPRGALHSGSDRTSGDHVSSSTLEIDIGTKLLRTQGICYIWSGVQ